MKNDSRKSNRENEDKQGEKKGERKRKEDIIRKIKKGMVTEK